MTDPTLTKLRLRYERAEREWQKRVQEARDLRQAVDEEWQLYKEHAKQLGVCPACIASLEKCECVALAGTSIPGVVTDTFKVQANNSDHSMAAWKEHQAPVGEPTGPLCLLFYPRHPD